MRQQHPRSTPAGTPRHRRAFIETVKLERWHRKVVYTVTVALVASGGLWLALHYFARVAGPFGEAHHPMEAWSLRAHGLSAMLSLLVLGSLVLAHMRRAWVLRRNRVSGLVLASIFVVLIASGYALYYFGSEELRPVISAIHWLLGLVCAPLLVLHIALGRRRAVGMPHAVTSARPNPPPAASAGERQQAA